MGQMQGKSLPVKISAIVNIFLPTSKLKKHRCCSGIKAQSFSFSLTTITGSQSVN